MADNDVTCSMSRSGNVWDNAVMESFFSLKTERFGRKTYRMRNHATAAARRRQQQWTYLRPLIIGNPDPVANAADVARAGALT